MEQVIEHDGVKWEKADVNTSTYYVNGVKINLYFHTYTRVAMPLVDIFFNDALWIDDGLDENPPTTG